MKTKVNLYVCSKPLQYFNARNLPKDETIKNILVIDDKFKGAYRFYESLKNYDTGWNEIHYVQNQLGVLFLCLFKYRVINLYYYLDFMLMEALLLYAIPCKNIFVYEEGISAYRADIFKNTAGYRRKIRKLLGISEYPGFHPRVKGIYVYSKEKYIEIFSAFRDGEKLHPLSFVTPFEQMIVNNIQLAIGIFQFDAEHIFSDVHNKKILLYITSWPFDETVFRNINISEYDYCVIKPHPHIRELQLTEYWKSNNIIIIDSLILAEFLVKILTDKSNKLTIYHHNSSSVMYLNGQQNIERITSF